MLVTVAQTEAAGGGDKIVFTLKWGKCETEGEETGHSGHLHLPAPSESSKHTPALFCPAVLTYTTVIMSKTRLIDHKIQANIAIIYIVSKWYYN